MTALKVKSLIDSAEEFTKAHKKTYENIGAFMKAHKSTRDRNKVETYTLEELRARGRFEGDRKGKRDASKFDIKREHCKVKAHPSCSIKI